MNIYSTLQLFQWFCLFYIIGINFVYLVLNILSLFSITDYMKRDGMGGNMVQTFTGFEPPISIIIPAYNEEKSIVSTIFSILEMGYPEFEIVLVNDGSIDSTMELLKKEFGLVLFPEVGRKRLETKPVKGIYRSRLHPDIRVIDKENGGKSDALNAGLNYSTYPLFCSVDADSLLQRDSLIKVVQPFMEDSITVAAGGTVRVANGSKVRGGFLIKAGLSNKSIVVFQIVEYMRAFLFGRLGWSPLNALLIISGAFGLFNKEKVMAINGYNTKTIGEDMDLVIRMHRNLLRKKEKYKITFVPDPICWTEAPEDLKTLKKQRMRWQRGLTESLWLNRGIMFGKNTGVVGWIAFPFMFFFEWIGPIIEMIGYALTISAYSTGVLIYQSAFLFFSVAVGFGVFFSTTALLLEEISFQIYSQPGNLLRLFFASVSENLGYRQLNAFWRVESMISWAFGTKAQWGEMRRIGSEAPRLSPIPENELPLKNRPDIGIKTSGLK